MKISIIGGGAMGTALASGLLLSNKISPADISISNPHIKKLEHLAEKGINIFSSNIEAIKNADLIIVAVKPWIVQSVISELEGHIDFNKTDVCLIVAGIPSEDIRKMFKTGCPSNLSVSMPNTAMSVAQSMTFIVNICGNPQKTLDLFGLVGKVELIEETKLPAAMAIASCGIAYAMRYVRASSLGAVELGIKASEAQEIVLQTLTGAISLLRQPGAHPESEIDKVTTPGGITIKGLNTMELKGFSSAIIEGLKASK